MNYVIKNCPCYNNERFIGGFLDDKATFCTYYGKKCQDCTDCVMKRIVELCKHIKSINKTNSYVGEYIEFTQHSPLANEILELLDIQEIE